MWDFSNGRPENSRYLVLGLTRETAGDSPELPLVDDLIASDPLLSDDGSVVLGAAAPLEAPDASGTGAHPDDSTFQAIQDRRGRV